MNPQAMMSNQKTKSLGEGANKKNTFHFRILPSLSVCLCVTKVGTANFATTLPSVFTTGNILKH